MRKNTSEITAFDLQTWRRKNGVSQAELAKFIGKHLMSISFWERGRTRIPPMLRHSLTLWEHEHRHELQKRRE